MKSEKFQELVLEQLTGLSKRLDRHDERFDRMEKRFDKMDERLDSHESLIETIAKKVNLLELGQQQIITQLSQMANVQNEIVSNMKVLVESDRL
ncbi:hypothetical protein JCM15765_08950 [Paradesulfitobacterium aromaticivorans]